MPRLEDPTPGARAKNLAAHGGVVEIVAASWHGTEAVTVTYRDVASGRLEEQLLFRHDELRLEIESP
jgi:hypothetical protein